LQEPIVSCGLGKLYNKDAILEYLLDKSAYGDGAEICGHVRSLKDVKTLQLTPNPAVAGSSTPPEPGAPPLPQFVCPLSQKEMSGGVPFVYITTCGHVFSAAGLRALAPAPGENAVCPQCQVKYTPGAVGTSDVRPINPTVEELEVLRAALPAAGSKKRKKKDAAGAEDEGADAERPAKKAKSSAASAKPAPTTNTSVAISARKALAVAEAEAKAAKATQSAAVQSLYTSKSGSTTKETFLTRGTFTRYA
jgi:hypothetical protein